MVFRWTFFMRQVDPQSKIVALGSTEDWNERFLKRFSEPSKGGCIASNDEVRLRGQGIRVQPGRKFHSLGLKYPSEVIIQGAIAALNRYVGKGSIELFVEEWQAQAEFTNSWPEDWLKTMSVYEIVLQQGRANLNCENAARIGWRPHSRRNPSFLHALRRACKRCQLTLPDQCLGAPHQDPRSRLPAHPSVPRLPYAQPAPRQRSCGRGRHQPPFSAERPKMKTPLMSPTEWRLDRPTSASVETACRSPTIRDHSP